jgi:hypothetical protein
MLWKRRCAAALVTGGSFLLAACQLLADEKSSTSPPPSSAEMLLRQALEQEVAGDAEGRARLLKEAAAADPSFAPARWHLGEIRVGEEWLPAAAIEKRAGEESESEYEVKRADAAGNSALLLKLARWCLKERMPDRARLHFWQVIAHPRASAGQIEDAARQLELVSVGGRILTRGDLKQEQEREKAVALAIARYRPILAEQQPALDRDFGELRDAAAAKLAAIDDPSVVPAIETYLGSHGEGFGEELMNLLARFPQFESTQTLVRFAVQSPYLSVRQRAIAELKERPKHDYLPTLMAGLVSPLQAQYQFQKDARGNIRYQQTLVQEKADATLVRHLEQLYRPQLAVFFGEGGGEGQKRADVFNHFAGAMVQSDIAMEISRLQLLANASKLAADQNNDRVFEALVQVTGQQLPADARQWWKWWQDYNQVHYPKPTYQLYAYSVHPYVARAVGISCFVKGTPVWTESGLRPIESIQPGDRVLSQDPDSGELALKVVMQTTVRPPTEASTLNILGESITTTLGHPLWVTGQGWEMAKHVQPGDQLHGIKGILVVSTIDPLPNKVEAHNLVVEGFGTYFVGNCGMLVHDNTYRRPTRALVPGLIP